MSAGAITATVELTLMRNLMPGALLMSLERKKQVWKVFMLRPAQSDHGPSGPDLRQFTAGAAGALRTIKSWPFGAYLLSIGVVLSSVLLIGLALSLRIIEFIVWALTAAALAGGLLFTVLEMRKLSRLSK
jgi:hypothetical protein